MPVNKARTERVAIVYLKIVATGLVITALAKAASVSGESEVLRMAEPLTGLKFSEVFLAAALCELIVAMLCLSRNVVYGLVAVAWIAVCLFGYRMALWWIGWQEPCGCLGNLTDALGVSPQLADNAMKGFLAVMLIGSISFLIIRWCFANARSSSPIAMTTI